MVKRLVYWRNKTQNVVKSNGHSRSELIQYRNEIMLGAVNTIMSIERRIYNFREIQKVALLEAK